MEYQETRYERIDDDYLELYSWDGLYRGVMFRDAAEADLALIPGRAFLDVHAIESGFLPKGATLVSGAASGINETRLMGEPDNADPASIEEQRLAVAARVAASRYVTEKRDAEARRRNPANIAQYEGIVAMMERDQRERAQGRADS